ncbi:hypothetical protein MHK_003819 [Candidatus Magnetomorum sp. HK-1]|nr:hypothetical protein MHK_003819 [Candidatus Magnetomorum sp. HK-1]
MQAHTSFIAQNASDIVSIQSNISQKADSSNIYTRAYLDNQLSLKIDQSGGTINGNLSIQGEINAVNQLSKFSDITAETISITTNVIADSANFTRLSISGTSFTVTTQGASNMITIPDQSGVIQLSGGMGSFTGLEINGIILSETELISLNGVNGSIQGQLDEKLSSNIGVSNANKVLLSDVSGNITVSSGESGKVLTTDENGNAIWDNINNATQFFAVESGSGVSAGDIVQYVNGNIIKGVGVVSTDLQIQSASH